MAECSELKWVWVKLVKWVKQHTTVNINLTVDMIILSNYTGQHKQLINMYIIAMKQYIYAKKCLGETVSFIEYVSKVVQHYQSEKLAIVNRKSKRSLTENGNYLKSLCKKRLLFF